VETKAALKARWQALWLLRREHSRADMCDVLDINPRMLYDSVVWYNQGGCASVAQHHRGGRVAPPRLTVERNVRNYGLDRYGHVPHD
jgi:hypothetical protein